MLQYLPCKKCINRQTFGYTISTAGGILTWSRYSCMILGHSQKLLISLNWNNNLEADGNRFSWLWYSYLLSERQCVGLFLGWAQWPPLTSELNALIGEHRRGWWATFAAFRQSQASCFLLFKVFKLAKLTSCWRWLHEIRLLNLTSNNKIYAYFLKCQTIPFKDTFLSAGSGIF